MFSVFARFSRNDGSQKICTSNKRIYSIFLAQPEYNNKPVAQCIDKDREEDNFVYSVNTYFFDTPTIDSLAPEIVLIRHILTSGTEKQQKFSNINVPLLTHCGLVRLFHGGQVNLASLPLLLSHVMITDKVNEAELPLFALSQIS